MEPTPPHIGLISPSGWGNLGDAAIQDSMILNLRRRIPAARITGITLNPDDTSRRHGVPAFPLGGQARAGRWIAGEHPTAAGPVAHPAPDGVRALLKRIPLLVRLVQWGRRVIGPAAAEVRHLLQAWRLVRSLDLLVVSGGGQVDDTWGGVFGGPYDLCKWGLLADAAGVPFAVASVGAESLASALSRLLARTGLRAAGYRSYRDAYSKSVIESVGLGWEDPIVPDLAFSLPVTPVPRPNRTPPVIGVSPIAYCDPRVWPRKDPAVYHTYLGLLEAVIRKLRESGHEVVLFTSDGPDRRVVEDLLARLPDAGLRAPQTGSLEDLFRALADVDVVLASRLHGVLLSLLAGRPVLALSYHRKVRDHMEAMGLGSSCLPLEGTTPAQVLAGLQSLCRDASRLVPAISREVAVRQDALAGQYDRLVGSLRARA